MNSHSFVNPLLPCGIARHVSAAARKNMHNRLKPSPGCLATVCLSLLTLIVTVCQAATITVQNVNDSGPGSLRQAVLDAHTLHPTERPTIDFSSAVLRKTIILTSGEIVMHSQVIISGPGADRLTISGNHSSRIFTIPAEVEYAEIDGLTLSNGFAAGQSGGHGGAILNAGQDLEINACAFAGNSVASSSNGDGHGGAIENTGVLVANNSTFNNNSAQGGGGIYNTGQFCRVDRSTFTKNSVFLNGNAGGGAILHRGDFLILYESTIADNTADGGGGGVYNDTPKDHTSFADNIIAGNSAPNSPDTYGAYQSDGYNLVGVSDAGNGFTRSSDHSGSAASPLNPKLRPLANNGGPTQTMALQPDSLAVDQGRTTNGSIQDQRFFPRPIDYPGIASAAGGDGSDIGAYELTPPLAETTDATEISPTSAQLNAFVNANGAETTVHFDFGLGANSYGGYSDEKSIGGSTLPLGFNEILSGLHPGTTYHFRIVATNLNGKTYGVDKAFTTVAAALTVQNSNDSGPGSLRQAVLDAYRLYPNDPAVIDFGSTVQKTITLISGPIEIQSKVLYIRGPSANLLTVSGNHNSRIFTVSAGSSLNVSRLTLSDGFDSGAGGGQNAGHGGAILNAGRLSAFQCAFVGNSVSGSSTGDGHGGAIENSKSLSVYSCTFNNNSAQGGGAIYNGPGGDCVISLSTFTKNMVTFNGGGGGGAILNRGTIEVEDCTIADNTADAAGGGIYTSDVSRDGSAFANTIIALNHAPNSPDTYGAYTSYGYNLVGISDAGNGFTKSTDHSGTVSASLDPKLAPLANNGGPVQTMALQTDSPAIDQGLTSSNVDERGFPSKIDYPEIPSAPGGNNADIGAFELGVSSPTPTPIPTPTPASSTLAIISTRLRVETGDNALIGGFIVTGTQPKKVIIRAIGPSLGLPGQLANPTLELYSGQTVLNSDNNWVDSPDKQAIIDSTIPPTNDLESAIVATLPANGAGYTAVVRGANNTTGIAVVQVYDLDRSVDSKLANISTRGLVQTGDNVLIAGTIVLGQASQKVIIRAIGPSLSIPGKLLDPTLQLVDANGTELAFNDNWRTGGQEGEIIATTVPPTDDAESAIVFTLPANGASYTAIVRGRNDSTGIGVVEVYSLQ
jgi:hypothetical protein